VSLRMGEFVGLSDSTPRTECEGLCPVVVSLLACRLTIGSPNMAVLLSW
jgi:hypothetical protein